jgi:transcriptional regulator with XRE-family HTH domain
MEHATTFGPLLRHWRQVRAVSQEQLAELSEVSTRHISFIENGRSSPSREMVLILGSALDLPLRERNTLLGAAGFASVYAESPLDSPEMAPVQRALDHLLRHQEPFPAAVVDRAWNVQRLNDGATRVLGALMAAAPVKVDPTTLGNLLVAILHPAGLRSIIVNWSDVAGELLGRLHREALQDARGDGARRMLERVRTLPDMPEQLLRPSLTRQPSVFIPLHVTHQGRDVRFFTTITSLGTPLDVTAQETRIESYFPADEATDQWVRALR